MSPNTSLERTRSTSSAKLKPQRPRRSAQPLDGMSRCPHCSASFYPLWRRVVEPWNGAVACPDCGAQVRRSDKAKLFELVASQLLAAGLLFSLFLLPWWASTMLIIVSIAGMLVLPDLLFPPVVAEQFGSVADTKHAALRFWIAAPIALIALVAAFVAMWSR